MARPPAHNGTTDPSQWTRYSGRVLTTSRKFHVIVTPDGAIRIWDERQTSRFSFARADRMANPVPMGLIDSAIAEDLGLGRYAEVFLIAALRLIAR